MSTSHTTSTEAKASEADVIINRLNVSLARSQRLINSWLPPKSEKDNDNASSENVEEDFRSMTDEAGIGSKAAYGDEEYSASALRKKRMASNDKFLEQLLGKKAAQAHRKAREKTVEKSVSASERASTKALTSRPKREREDESEDDAGRTAAFKSRKAGKVQRHVIQHAAIDNGEGDQLVKSPDEDVTIRDTDQINDSKSSGAKHQPAHQKTAKQRNTSYLDELLAQRAKKKKRKGE